MELKDLVGLKKLDSVDFSTEVGGYYPDEECTVCRFRLDGVLYAAYEDPEDGYRSCMKELVIVKNNLSKNIFDPIDVMCRYNNGTEYYESDILEIVDIVTGKIILEVGTDHYEDYYPLFVARFDPTAMCLNN